MSILEVGNNELDKADEVFRVGHYYDVPSISDRDWHLIGRATRLIFRGTPYVQHWRSSMGLERLILESLMEEPSYEYLSGLAYYPVLQWVYNSGGGAEVVMNAQIPGIVYSIYKNLEASGIVCSVRVASEAMNIHGEDFVSFCEIVLPCHKNLGTKDKLIYTSLRIFQDHSNKPVVGSQRPAKMWVVTRAHIQGRIGENQDHQWSEESKMFLHPTSYEYIR